MYNPVELCCLPASELKFQSKIYSSFFPFFYFFKFGFFFTNQAYLARLQGSPSGLVTWQFDFTSCSLVVDTVTIATKSITSKTGLVEWKLEVDEEIVKNLAFSSGM